MVFPRSDSKRWTLITGASSGIGEAFAKRFAREGWNVVLVARSGGRLENLARALEVENQVSSVSIQADLTERTAPRNIYDELKKRRIELDGLVNNAGFGFGGKFVEVPLEQYLGMIDLNIRCLVELTHLFLPEMIRRKQGLILNVSSTASHQPLPFSSVYAASKAFVSSFTEALWLETRGTGIRVLNLCPGVTKTEFGIRAGLRDFRTDPIAEAPEQVVETAFRALGRKGPTVISGWSNRFLVCLERFVPRRLLLELVLIFQKSRGHT